MQMRTLIPGLMVAALVAGLPETLAAVDVELRFVEHGGGPLSGRHARLHFSASSHFPTTGYWPVVARKPLASDGRVRFEGLGPGTYKVSVDLRGSRWISPDANPLRPPPVFTISAGDKDLELEVEIFRGVPVRVYLDLPVAARGFQVRFHHPASGAVMSAPLKGDGRETVRLLPRGLWEVEVLPIKGFLLVGVLVDRQDWMGTTPVLDLVTDDLPPDLVFSFTAQVEIEGTVTEINGLPSAVMIRATLLQAGPWQAAALARGVRIPQSVETPLDELGRYHAYLPEGLWRVEPVGEHLLETTPENAQRDLSSGDRLRTDFTVEVGPGEDFSTVLQVLVLTEDPRSTPDGAFGAVFEDDGSSQTGGVLVWSGRLSHRLLEAYGLPAGRYEVAVGHSETLETRLSVEYDPEQLAEELPRLVLRRGATVKMLAVDLEGRRTRDIQLHVERLDELPELLVAASEFIAAKKQRTITSDLSGRGLATGFYPGVHRFEARINGERKATGIVEVRTTGGDWQPFLELPLGSSDILEIEARERPAARIVASLDCGDDWQLPETLDIRLLDGWALTSKDSILHLEDLVLAGKRHHRLVLGPLEAGRYVLGLHPEGFDRWTWVYGAVTPEEAEALLIKEKDRDARRAIDLGPVQVECGPAVDLLLRVATGDPFPSQRDIRMFARSRSQVDGQGLRDLDLKRRRARLELRGMPRGEQVLEVRLEHPWFLPAPELLWEVPIELERGMFREVELEVEALGGAIDLRGLEVETPGSDATVRAVQGKFSTERVEVDHGRALIPSLPPGLWRLELCLDVDCEEAVLLGDAEVERSQTLVLHFSG